MADTNKDQKEPAEPIDQESNENITEEKVEESTQEKLNQELADCKDRYLRLAAEFDNFKKISVREQTQHLKFANENLITALLPVLDNLFQAVKAGKKDGASSQELIVGVEMVLKQLSDTLSKFGVEFFDALGQAFDPSRHEALCEQESDEEPGTVVEEYQKGCLLHGRLIRAARVAVAKTSSM